MLRPARLQPDDTIAIIAPSSPVDRDAILQATELITGRGYRVALGDHLLNTMQGNSYLAGTDAERAADIHQMFARADVKAIFCARGGYGVMRLFDLLDWNLIAAHPKIVTGYSDITSLHLALAQTAGMVSFHSPNATSLARLDQTAYDLFWRLLESADPAGPLPVEPSTLKTLVPGIATGTLAGGCICLLAHACGSRHTPIFKDKIVLLEDVHEAIYRVDRDLIQMRNAGAFEGARGFVIGTISHWQEHEKANDPPTNTPDSLWNDIIAPLGKPTIVGFPFGHEPNPITLPLGIQATLDATNRTLSLIEPAVQDMLP